MSISIPKDRRLYIEGMLSRYLASNERILWQGTPDKQAYVAWARRHEHLSRLLAAPIVFGVVFYLVRTPLVVTLLIWLGLGAIGALIRDWKIRSASFLGVLVVTNKRVITIGMRAQLRQIPRDAELRYLIVQRKSSYSIRFSRAGHPTIRMRCLREPSSASLRKVMES